MASRNSRQTAASKADSKTTVLPLVQAVVKALDAKKAGELRVLYVGEQSTITDYLVLASGQANTHLRALRIELERVLDEAGASIAGIDSSEGSGWLVFDAYQIMIHLFLPEQRQVYQLEQLWRDGEEVDVTALLVPEPSTPKAAVKAVAQPAQKAPTKKVAAGTKKVATKKAATKKAVVKKAAASKTVAKKAPAKKTAVKKVAAKTVKKKAS